jgi:hypothetical protein
MIIVQAGIKETVTMAGYVGSVTALHIRVSICVFSVGKDTYRFSPFIYTPLRICPRPKTLQHIDPATRIVPVPLSNREDRCNFIVYYSMKYDKFI